MLQLHMENSHKDVIYTLLACMAASTYRSGHDGSTSTYANYKTSNQEYWTKKMSSYFTAGQYQHPANV